MLQPLASQGGYRKRTCGPVLGCWIVFLTKGLMANALGKPDKDVESRSEARNL